MKTSPKPAARKGAPKRESEEQARAARERKRAAKHKGLKAGSRHGESAHDDQAKRGAQGQDPRVGSRKPVSLSPAVAPAKPKPKPQAKPAATAKPDPAALEKELLAIENDERLSRLLDRLDEGQPITSEEQDWVDGQLARHQALMAELGLDDEDEDDEPGEHSEELWQRFMDDNFDPNALGDEPHSGKQ
ncbi:Der GTPase-activating protein YihI [Pseudaeromonas sp. ZJS20]|uniref:Der GTPase-activating protein YihI n=1 Tax=Pseudaeromonas aegiceratis TaxID=3153928 RepID=UPI00390CBF0A